MAASLRETLLLLAVQAGRVLARQPEPLAALVVYPGQPEPLVLPPLLAVFLAKVAGQAVAEVLALGVLAVLEVAAPVVEAVELVALHTLLAPVVSVVLAGHWFWSFDYAAICRC